MNCPEGTPVEGLPLRAEGAGGVGFVQTGPEGSGCHPNAHPNGTPLLLPRAASSGATPQEDDDFDNNVDGFASEGPREAGAWPRAPKCALASYALGCLEMRFGDWLCESGTRPVGLLSSCLAATGRATV